MPITIKSTGMKYKNPDTGVYQGVDMLEEATIRDVIVDVYSPTSSYSVGKHCLYNGELYCCTTAIPDGGEAWNLAHWEKTKVTDELEDIKGAVDSIGSDDVANESNVTGTTVSDALDTLDEEISGLGSDDVANDSNVSGTTVSDALDTLDGAISDVNDDLSVFERCKGVGELSDFGATSFNFSLWRDVTLSPTSVVLPAYAKGSYITTGNDAIVIAITVEGKEIVAYRNGSNWVNVSNIHDLIGAITPFDSSPTSGSTKGVTSGGVYTAVTNTQNSLNDLKTVKGIGQISDLSGDGCHFIGFTANVNVGGISIPRYSKGVFVATSTSDATLYAIDGGGVLYTSFRNNGTWQNTNKGKLPTMVSTAPDNVTCNGSTATQLATLSLTPGSWLVTAFHEFTQSVSATYTDVIIDNTNGTTLCVDRNISMMSSGGRSSTGFITLSTNAVIKYETTQYDSVSRTASHIRFAASRIL